MSTPWRTKPGIRCTPGSRNARQLFQDYDYPIFLAEVASTFNEELLTHYLLEQTTDRKMRAYIINRQIDDLRGTLFRQTMFAEFEKVIHAIEESGDALTLDVFKSEYRKLLEAYFGKASCSIRNSTWNVCASRIFTAPSTSTNMPLAFRRRWRSPNASSRRKPAAWKDIWPS